jgi:hypothetical protein
MKAPKEAAFLMLEKEKLARQTKKIKERNDEINAKLAKLFKDAGDDEFELEDGYGILRVKLSERDVVKYDVELLRATFSDSTYKQLIEKHIEVDRAELRAVFEDHPGLKKLLRPVFIITDEASESKIQIAYQKGLVTVKQLKKCCTASTQCQLRVTRKMHKEEENLE